MKDPSLAHAAVHCLVRVRGTVRARVARRGVEIRKGPGRDGRCRSGNPQGCDGDCKSRAMRKSRWLLGRDF